VGRWRANGELAAPYPRSPARIRCGAQDHGTDGGVGHALRTLPPVAHTAVKTSLPHVFTRPAGDLVRRILDVRRPGQAADPRRAALHVST
jgi:hypothetical protein